MMATLSETAAHRHKQRSFIAFLKNIKMSLFPVRPSLCELSLMCQICQSFSTMLKEAFVTAMQPAGPLWRSADGPSHPALCVSVSSRWPIVEAGQADPTSGIRRGPCLVCVSASPVSPVRDSIVLPPPSF